MGARGHSYAEPNETWPIIAGVALLWIAVGFVLVYDHNVEKSNPDLTPAQRRTRAEELYGIAGFCLLSNGVLTVLRFRQIYRTTPAE